MSKKLEIIKQDLTLVTINKDNTLEVRKFNQCYDGGETLKVKVEGYSYYVIKGNDYYVGGDYALVVNKELLQSAINDLCNNRIDLYSKEIKQFLEWVEIKKENINKLKQNIR